MVLDINLFRVSKGGNPEKVKESQRRRYASTEIVDKVIELTRPGSLKTMRPVS